MDEDEELRFDLTDYVNNVDKEGINSVQKSSAKVNKVEDNVIHITIDTSTKGNA